MTDRAFAVILRGLCLRFDRTMRQVTIDPRAAPPGTPEGGYRAVTLSFDELEALLIARFMSARKEDRP